MELKLLSVIFLLILPVIISQRFNVFKSYKDADVRPKNYGKNTKYSHPIGEYLTTIQKEMYNKRYTKDKDNEMFSNNWSGFRKDKMKALRGRKRKRTSNSTSRKLSQNELDMQDFEFQDISYTKATLIVLSAILTLAGFVYKFYFASKSEN